MHSEMFWTWDVAYEKWVLTARSIEDWEGNMKIVCICGSTRFLSEERKAYIKETMKGNIVLSHSGSRTEDKQLSDFLGELHLRKIDMVEEILVLNVGGYIGDSTKNEINYAKAHGKAIRFLEEKE